MKPRSYSLPVSAAVALLREVRCNGVEVAIYPRALSNTFGDLRATATQPLRGVVSNLDLATGEGTLKLSKAHDVYFESAWLNVAAHAKIYSALISAFPLSPKRITFELPSQLEVDSPEQSLGQRFDDSLLLVEGATSYALFHVRDHIYRVRVEKSIPFDFTARLASKSDGPDFQGTVINHPAPGWVDVELTPLERRLSSPPSMGTTPPARSGVRPLQDLLDQRHKLLDQRHKLLDHENRKRLG